MSDSIKQAIVTFVVVAAVIYTGGVIGGMMGGLEVGATGFWASLATMDLMAMATYAAVTTLSAGIISGLTSKGLDATRENFGSKTSVRSQTAPRQIIYGECRVGGVITQIHTSGSVNDVLSMFIVISGHPIDSLSSVRFDDKELVVTSSTVSSETMYTATNAEFTNTDNANSLGSGALIRYSFHDGNQTAHDGRARVLLNDTLVPDTHLFRQCAYVFLEMVYDHAKLNRIPNISFTVKGKKVYDPRSYEFNANTAVNTSTEVITYKASATSAPFLSTGDTFTYDTNSGTALGGLTNGTSYYVIKVSSTTIKLATTLANAVAGTAINITSKPSSETQKFTIISWSSNPILHIRDYLTDTTYGLKAEASEINDTSNAGGFQAAATICDQTTTLPAISFNGSSNSVVVAGSDHILITSAQYHTLATGNAVVYDIGSGGAAIAGLTDDATYYVIKATASGSDFPIKLALTEELARAGTAIDITDSGASGTAHTLTVSEIRYTSNGFTNMAASGQGVIEGLLSTCGGFVTYTNGQFNAWAAAGQGTPSLTITDDDLIQPLVITTKSRSGDSYNEVKAIYVDRTNAYVATDTPVYKSTTYLNEDTPNGSGGATANYVKQLEMQLPFTTSSTMAQRLARIGLNLQRQSTSATALVNLKFLQLQPKDWVYMTNDRLSYDEKIFEVTSVGMQFVGSGESTLLACRLGLKETATAVYGFTYADYTTEQTVTKPDSVDVLTTTSATAVGVPASVVVTNDKPMTINLSWANPSSRNLRSVKIHARTANTTPTDDTYLLATVGAGEPSKKQEITFGKDDLIPNTSDNLAPDTNYYFWLQTVNTYNDTSAYVAGNQAGIIKDIGKTDLQTRAVGSAAFKAIAGTEDFDATETTVLTQAFTAGEAGVYALYWTGTLTADTAPAGFAWTIKLKEDGSLLNGVNSGGAVVYDLTVSGVTTLTAGESVTFTITADDTGSTMTNASVFHQYFHIVRLNKATAAS